MTVLRSLSFATVLRLAVLAALPCILTGCLLNPAPVQAITYFDLRPAEAAIENGVASGSDVEEPIDGVVVAVDKFESLGPYHRRLVYRQSDQELQFDEYHRWAAEPADLIAAEIYRQLQASGEIGRVTLHRKLAADYLVFGELEALESRPGKEAVVALHIVLQHRDGKAWLDRSYEESEPFATTTPQDYVAASAMALQTLLARVTLDIREALKTAQSAAEAAAAEAEGGTEAAP